MEILLSSFKNVFFGIIVLIINIPIFWSFNGAIDFLRSIAKGFGLEI